MTGGLPTHVYSSAMHEHVPACQPMDTKACKSSRASVAPRARRSIGSAATGAIIVESGITLSHQDSRTVRSANVKMVHPVRDKMKGTTRLTKSARESLSVPHVGMPA